MLEKKDGQKTAKKDLVKDFDKDSDAYDRRIFYDLIMDKEML